MGGVKMKGCSIVREGESLLNFGAPLARAGSLLFRVYVCIQCIVLALTTVPRLLQFFYVSRGKAKISFGGRTRNAEEKRSRHEQP